MSFKETMHTKVVRRVFEVGVYPGFRADRYKADIAKVPDDAECTAVREDHNEHGACIILEFTKETPEPREDERNG